MKPVNQFTEIYLHRLPVDGRKQINGLAAIVETGMGLDPFSEALFVFTTRKYDYLKLLYWNKSGFALWSYRLEEEKFRWPKKWEKDTVDLTHEQLSWLLDGYDIMRMKPHATLKYHSIS